MATAALDTGLLRVVSNADMNAAEDAEAAKKAAAKEHDRPVLQGLAAHVMDAWSSARDTKRDVVDRLLRAQSARLGEYTPEKLREIRNVGGAEEYARVTANKCRVAESWLRDVYLGQTEKPWTLKHTPNPQLPPSDMQQIEKTIAREIAQVFAVMQTAPPDSMVSARRNELEDAVRERMHEEARRAIERMEAHMHDQLVEGGFDVEWSQFINDLVTYPAAHFKGPVLRMHRTVEWVQEGKTWVPKAIDKIAPEFERVDPFRCFPSSNATTPQEGAFIEHVTYTRDDLYRLIGVEGFNEGAIRSVLEDYGRGGLTDWLGFHDLDDQERALDGQDREKGPLIDIDGLEYHGPVSGRDLLEWGLDKKLVPDEDADYEATVWLIGRWVIKAQLNHDPTRVRPYFKVCWEDIPGSYWGLGLVDALGDVQDVVNAAVRALVNNMSMCLTGDTVVYRHERRGKKAKHRPTASGEVTLSQLWAQKHKHNSGLRRNILRSLDEATGEFFGNRVVNIYDNGVQPVYEVTTATGYRIKATLAHRFMDDTNEYKQLVDFRVGDRIAVNGTSSLPRGACEDCGASTVKPGAKRCKACAAHNSTWNLKQAADAMENRAVRDTSARARRFVREQMKDACEQCAATQNLHIHHMDRDPYNGHPGNLRTLCASCHSAWHARHDSFGNPRLHTYVDHDTVVSITYVGEEQVFDLEMTAPNHNFVANGFVSHNCSGPQVGVNVDRLPPGEDITTLTPWKVWQFANSQYGSNDEALKFFQPQSNVNDLLTVIEKFYQFADDWSLIPRYMSGNDRVGGAGRTASGLSMLLNAANKGLKGVVSSIDTQVLSPLLAKLYTHNMLFSEDQSIKGDADVMARGAVSLMQLETLQLRRNEFLQVTNNPVDNQIVGVNGRTELLREIAKGLEMDVNRVVPKGPAGGGMPQQAPPQQAAQGSQEQLMNGAPVTDNFSPNALGTAL